MDVQTLIRINQTSWGHPTSWDIIRDDGKRLKVHYRNGILSVYENGHCIQSVEHGDKGDGIIHHDTMLKLLGMRIRGREVPR